MKVASRGDQILYGQSLDFVDSRGVQIVELPCLLHLDPEGAD